MDWPNRPTEADTCDRVKTSGSEKHQPHQSTLLRLWADPHITEPGILTYRLILPSPSSMRSKNVSKHWLAEATGSTAHRQRSFRGCTLP